MRLLIALGGNALLKRGEPMTAQNQRANVRTACEQIAKAYEGNELIISHGNGPQVGLLALQNNAYKAVPMYPLDVIGAESLGMIGYMIQQELANFVPKSATLCNVLTQTEVDPKDPAFQHPTKPVGPVYTKEEAEALAAKEGWSIAPDNDKFRRVVPSPEPKRIFGLKSLKTLVEAGHIVICCGGGGIPTYYDEEGRLRGAEAVIDKDLASSVLAADLDADLFIIATDVDGAYLDWASPNSAASPRPIRSPCANTALPRAPWVRRLKPPAASSKSPGRPPSSAPSTRSTKSSPAVRVRASSPRKALFLRKKNAGI